MTTQQLYLFNGVYLIMTVVAAVLTRATPRRIVGAVAGGLAAGLAGLGVVAFGEKAGWWHQVVTWQPYFIGLLVLNSALCGYAFLITWRIARRFGARGLALAWIFVAVIGPPRDYWYMRRFPERSEERRVGKGCRAGWSAYR